MQVPFYRHSVSPESAADIAKVLASPILTSGPVGRHVEDMLRAYFDIDHAYLVNSWTNGCVATLLAMDIGPGDEVIVPAMTFIATANAVELIGAKPVFCDVDPHTLLIDIDKAAALVTERTKAIIPVHIYGQMLDVKDLKNRLPAGIRIIEDCAHCFEGEYKGDKPGRHSDVAIFSFYATKNVACGEGGAIITRNAKLGETIAVTRLHGMSAGAADRFQKQVYKHWDMLRLGVKANLPDLLAALLPHQIETVEDRLVQRKAITDQYEAAFADLPFVEMQGTVPESKHAHHLFPIWVPPLIRDQVLRQMNEAGVGCTVNYRCVTKTAYYSQRYAIAAGDFPISNNWGDGVISLPLFPGLEQHELDYVIDRLMAIGGDLMREAQVETATLSN